MQRSLSFFVGSHKRNQTYPTNPLLPLHYSAYDEKNDWFSFTDILPEIQFTMQYTKITWVLPLYCLLSAFKYLQCAHQEVVVLYFMANLTHYRLFITGFMMWKMIGLLLLRTCPAPAACSIYKTRTYQQTFAISRPSGNCNIGKSASILL